MDAQTCGANALPDRELVPRFDQVRAEWLAITKPLPSPERFVDVRRQAESLIDAGLWTSGPSDVLSVLGRQRDELMHSRMIGWLLGPTNRHGLGRRLLNEFVNRLWPDEGLLQTGPVIVETEVTGSAADDSGLLRGARADIVVRGDGVTMVIENKLDAGEGSEQCERLYWVWAGEPGDVRWVFLTPTGRAPVTAVSDVARAAWRTMSYAELRDIVAAAIGREDARASTGRSTAMQYLASLTSAFGAPR